MSSGPPVDQDQELGVGGEGVKDQLEGPHLCLSYRKEVLVSQAPQGSLVTGEGKGVAAPGNRALTDRVTGRTESPSQ